jgi:hypothetical protein
MGSTQATTTTTGNRDRKASVAVIIVMVGAAPATLEPRSVALC